MTTYTYSELEERLKALGKRPVMSGGNTPHHIWIDPDSGRCVLIPDLGGASLSPGTIDKVCERLGISRSELDG